MGKDWRVMLRREGGQCWMFADKRESQSPSSSGAQAGSSVVVKEVVLVVVERVWASKSET